ncbi:hypothetical protein Q3G72_023637 [Acer saccharum]|nr:hypothetical protein Q3G72_023637 [Acer saccharum]
MRATNPPKNFKQLSGRRTASGDSSVSHGPPPMDSDSQNFRRERVTGLGRAVRDQGLSEQAGGKDTDMLLDVETLGGNLCGQVQRLPKSPVTTKVFLVDEDSGLGGNIGDGSQGNKGLSAQTSVTGGGISTQVALEGLAEIVGLGDSSAVGVRGDGFVGIQSGFVGSGEGLYKVAVGLSSSTGLWEEVAAGVDSLSGQIPVGRAEVEVGEVQIKGRWKRRAGGGFA